MLQKWQRIAKGSGKKKNTIILLHKRERNKRTKEEKRENRKTCQVFPVVDTKEKEKRKKIESGKVITKAQ